MKGKYEFYDEFLKEYIPYVDKMVKNDPLTAGTTTFSWRHGGTMNLEFLKDHGLEYDHKLLDLGCGTLPLANVAIPYLIGGLYVGMDLNYNSIEAGKKIIGLIKGKKAKFFKNTNLKFDNTLLEKDFDYVFAFSVFNHDPFEIFEEFITNLHKITHDDSIVFLTCLLDRSPTIRPSSHLHKEFCYSFDEINRLCRKFGYRVERVDMTKYWKKFEFELRFLKMIKITKM